MKALRSSWIAIALLASSQANADPARRGDWQLYLSIRSFEDMTQWGGEVAAASPSGGLHLLDPGAGTMRRMTTREGLGSNRLSVLLRTDDGTLWVGSSDAGLTRLLPDGTARAVVGLAGSDIQSLSAEGDFLVYGTKTGAGPIVDGVPGLPYTVDDGLLSDDVRALAAYDQRVWFGTPAGITEFDRQRNRFVTRNDGLASAAEQNVLALLADADGILAGTGGGVFAYTEADSSWTLLGSGLTTGVRKLLRLANGDLLALTESSAAYSLPAGGSTWTSLGLSSLYRSVRSAVEMGATLWYGGVSRIDGPAFGDPRALIWEEQSGTEFLTRGLFGENQRSGMFDGDGGFWLGSIPPFGGLDHVTADGDIHPYGYLLSGGSPVGFCSGSPKLSVLLTSTGDIWTTAFTECVNRLRPSLDDDAADGDYLEFSDRTLLDSRRVTRIYEDWHGRLWFLSDGFGTHLGIDILLDPANPLDPASWMKVDSSNSELAGDTVFGLAFDTNGRVWISVARFGLQRWDTDGLLDDGSISTMQQPNHWRDLDTDAVFGLVEWSDPRSIALHPDGSIWVAALGEGVVRIDGADFAAELFEESVFGSGLLGNAVRDVQVDRRGDVWVAGESGLNRIRGFGFDAEIDSWTDRIVYESRGLGGRGFLPSIISPLPSADVWWLDYESSSDRLLVCTAGGTAIVSLTESVGVAAELGFRLYPNPARAGSSGAYADEFEGSATVRVFDLQGQLLIERSDYRAGDGPFWDLRTIRNEFASNGLYIVQLEQGGQRREAVLAIER